MKKLLKGKQKGITLIALIITIIVLLILAGVALSAITGNESAINKATQGRTENDRGAARDAASIMATGYIQEYMTKKYSQGNTSVGSQTTGQYVASQMNNKTSGEFTFTTNGSALTVSKGGNTVVTGTIEDNGTITWDANSSGNENGNGSGTGDNGGDNGGSGNNNENTGTTVTAAQVNSLIGTTVNYSGYTADYDGDWIVFYATDEEMFIIPKMIIETDTSPLRDIGRYSGSTDVRNMTYGATWNEKWLDACEENESTEYKAKATAFYCDSSNWSKYVSVPATYAVGGPTMELLVASIRAHGGTDYTNDMNSTTNVGYPKGVITELSEPYIAKYNASNYGTWWLASPGQDDIYSVCVVNVNGMVLNTYAFNYYGNTGSYIGVRPLVSIPMSSVRINENIVEIIGVVSRLQNNNMSVLTSAQIDANVDSIEGLTAAEKTTRKNALKDTSKVKEVLTGNVPVPVGYNYVEGTSTATGVTKPENGSWGVVVKDENQNEWVWVPVNSAESVNPKSLYEPVNNVSVANKLKDTGVTLAKIDGLKLASIDGIEELKLASSSSSSEGGQEEQEGTVTTTTNKRSLSVIGLERGIPDDPSSYREPAILSDYDKNPEYYQQAGNFGSAQEFADAMVQDYNDMIDSITKYGGFYVGRYELSGTNNGNDQAITNAKVQKNQTPMDRVNWYRLYQACRNFGTTATTSTMIFGTQWDVMCLWAQKKGDTISYSEYQSNRHSGNYSALTGTNSNDIRNNIYDVEGSRYEWTQEAYSTYYRAARGGYYSDYDSASYRDFNFYPDYGDYSGLGSRATLYIK